MWIMQNKLEGQSAKVRAQNIEVLQLQQQPYSEITFIVSSTSILVLNTLQLFC